MPIVKSCPCGSQAALNVCCGRYLHDGMAAPDAPSLMRSRYTAFVLHDARYLLATWHPGTRPAELDFEDAPKWLGLQIRATSSPDPDHATVEFVARYRVGGRAHRLDETSRFVREDGKWFYVDGDIKQG